MPALVLPVFVFLWKPKASIFPLSFWRLGWLWRQSVRKSSKRVLNRTWDLPIGRRVTWPPSDGQACALTTFRWAGVCTDHYNILAPPNKAAFSLRQTDRQTESVFMFFKLTAIYFYLFCKFRKWKSSRQELYQWWKAISYRRHPPH